RITGMSYTSDTELLAQFRSGSACALATIFERYEGPLFRFLVGILRDHHLAEDALQETFVRALERLDRVDPDHLRGWLFTVAYHQAMLSRRRQKAQLPLLRAHTSTVPDPTPTPWLQAAAQDDARRLRELLEKLPASQREVIRQRI